LGGWPEGRLSVSVVEVADGQEAAFLAIARQFSVIMAKKHYGRTDIVRDESSPNMFYAVRHWASASAAVRDDARFCGGRLPSSPHPLRADRIRCGDPSRPVCGDHRGASASNLFAARR